VSTRLPVAATLVVALALPAQAQYRDAAPPPPPVAPEVPYVYDPSDEIAPVGAKVVAALEQATQFCAALPDASYRIDCLAERMTAIAASMPASGPYAYSRAAIADAGRKLAAVSRRYADPTKSRNRYAAGAMRTARPLTAVRPEAAAQANRQATAIIAEAETVLLRSSATQPAAAAQIERIAVAVGSNKVLLRST
jgi:hypothetical protein